MIYEVVETQTISIGKNEVVERTLLVVTALYMDEGINHTKVFEFDITTSDEDVKTTIEEYGRSLIGNTVKIRTIELGGEI